MRLNPTQCEHNWLSGPKTDMCDSCRIRRLRHQVDGQFVEGFGESEELAVKDFIIKVDRICREKYGT